MSKKPQLLPRQDIVSCCNKLEFHSSLFIQKEQVTSEPQTFNNTNTETSNDQDY